MSFTELYSDVINQKDSYVKKIKVLLINGNDGKHKSYWVDIRCYYLTEACKPTKFGVCITFDELNKLLPNMMALKDCNEENYWRRVSFEKSDKAFLYNLNVSKIDGKETSIALTFKDIQKIYFMKDKIFNCIIE
jgi:hypothetical protein